MKKYPIPTGYLVVDDYSRGQLETLSIGDYGKEHNVRAEFLGLTKEINGVPNRACKPLSEKWVITLSTQFGCPMKCNFCSCPQIGYKGNSTYADLERQFMSAIALFPDVHYCERLNVHFARMGEPIFNYDVFRFTESLYKEKAYWNLKARLRTEVVHPVLTTCLPKYSKLKKRVMEWCDIKNKLYNGQAGLQLSINSTDENQRQEMFGGKTLTLEDISYLGRLLPSPVGRKYCLNFAYATGFEVNARKLAKLFCPTKFMCKITPIHNNKQCREKGIQTVDGYQSYSPYAQIEKDLISVGFDVLVFVPSMDEENGLVTCGNAILGDDKMSCENVINIEGVG